MSAQYSRQTMGQTRTTFSSSRNSTWGTSRAKLSFKARLKDKLPFEAKEALLALVFLAMKAGDKLEKIIKAVKPQRKPKVISDQPEQIWAPRPGCGSMGFVIHDKTTDTQTN